jgi:hypothetical protein
VLNIICFLFIIFRNFLREETEHIWLEHLNYLVKFKFKILYGVWLY